MQKTGRDPVAGGYTIKNRECIYRQFEANINALDSIAVPLFVDIGSIDKYCIYEIVLFVCLFFSSDGTFVA